MHGLVFHGTGEKKWESKPDPELHESMDAIVRIDTTTICGTDLHILKGHVPTVAEGRTLGHEAVGTVVATGDAVRNVREGDRVLVSCISACGRCVYCRRSMYSQCLGGGGWILGHLIDGTQAQYVRIPFADNGLYPVPDGLTDEHVLQVADILPTGFEVGVLNGQVKPGDVVAVVGTGPVGLAAIMTCRLFGPSRIIAIDLSDHRLARAKQFGADITINNSSEDPIERVRELGDGLGVDVAIEAVGVPATFELCTEIVRAGGRVANVGVHGEPATLHLERFWIKNITITTGLVDTSSTPTLLKLIAEGRLDPLPLATHHFKLDEMLDAYDVFANVAETDALKVVLSAA
jgi:alcohol dehydrogenase